MSTLRQDVRYALRLMWKSPGFTAVAALSLGLGIGANTAIFSVLNALFLTPLPVAHPERVVALYTSDFSGPRFGGSSYPDYLDFQQKTDLFQGLAAYTPTPMSLQQGDHTDRVFGELVSANYFAVAGVGAARGRVLRAEEDGAAAAAPVLVLSDAFWRRRFAADPALVGSAVSLNGHPFTVIGIAPPGFSGMTRGLAVDLWAPLTAAGAIPSGDRLDGRGNRWLFVLGRLAPGVALEMARVRLDSLAGQLQQAYPDNWTDVRRNRRVISVVPESEARIIPEARGAVLGFLGLLSAVVGLVLLIACTNVANLMLARATTRRREIALRLSLGASRWRLTRQLLTESVLLALLGGAAGVLIAVWATAALTALRPPLPVPVQLDLTLDARVLCFTLLLSVLTGFLFGLVPALQASRPSLMPALKEDVLAAGGSPGHWSPRRFLVVAQIALSLVLLVGSGLFLQSLRNAHRIDPGFEAKNLLLLSTDLRLGGYSETAGRDLQRRLVERTSALPGALAVSLAESLPLGLGRSRRGVSIEGYEPQSGEDMEVHTSTVGPEYFRTMGIPLTRGRDLAETDGARAPRVAVVNEAFVRRYWPDANPIGRHIGLGSRRGQGDLFEIVGVAKDGKYVTLGEDPKPFFYLPLLQRYSADATLLVRTAGDPQRFIPAVRNEIRALDPSLPVYDVKTMTDHMGLSLLPARVAGSVLGFFGVVAIALASIGIYGIMSHAVGQRTREIGVRVALGARPADLLGMVLGQGIRLTSVGLAAGLALALGLARLVSSFLYGVSATDPTTFAVILVVLGGVALLATYLPARRATRVDPIVALRCE